MIDKYTFTKKEVAKSQIRSFVEGILHSREYTLQFCGKYNTWEEALKECTGYDADTVFEKVKQAAIAVRDGKACFERDGYLFYEKQTNFPIFAILLSIYVEMGELKILDFGGSLGSMYFQHKDVLKQLGSNLSWTIVEQKHFVEFGKKELCDGILDFEYRIQDVDECNCILFGGALQCIENYEEFLLAALERRSRYLIIDRTPISNRGWISIERVHEPIYEASYPFYVFDREQLVGANGIVCQHGYTLVEQWVPSTREEFSLGDRKCIFESFLFRYNL